MPSRELPSEINVVTLNCWGLKFISTYRRERLLEIGKRLAQSPNPPHIVGLQECWTQEDYLNIRKHTRAILPYGKFYFSGIFGGGLAILSKWPLEESMMHPYPLNGRPSAVFRGDWFVGKGVACAKIRMGPSPKDVASVFCTHLHAPYEEENIDVYLCHRASQAWEISRLMRAAAEKGHLVIGLGDFNMLPQSLPYRIVTSHAPVQDAWACLHPKSSIGAAQDAVEKTRGKPIPTAEFNILENGAASDGPFNTWRWPKKEQKRLRHECVQVDPNVLDEKGKRLDYIFFGEKTRSSARPFWSVKNVKLGMMERHPTLNCSLSDHFSVEATLVQNTSSEDRAMLSPVPRYLAMQRHDIRGKSQGKENRSPQPEHTLTNGSPEMPKAHVEDEQLEHALTTQSATESREMYDEILGMIDKFSHHERQQRLRRLCNAGAGLAVTIGCLIATCWSPKPYVSFILCLVSTLYFAIGTVDFFIGLLFVGSELRVLREFEWEIRNAKLLALGLGANVENEISMRRNSF